jgi:hypothetical protein|tara:strand:+ start:381 stop:1127 length:747 start_codon:yes stop_codon:yes gene_type:complete
MKTKLPENRITINKPRLNIATFLIEGTAPYVQHKFSKKTRTEMLQKHLEGTKSKNKTKREPRDIEADYREAMHLTIDDKHGIPAPAFRAAMISACRVAGFQMTKAKLSCFIEPDDFDADDGTPLVYIEGEPEMHQAMARVSNGEPTIAIRPMWRTWSARLRVRFDYDQFGYDDVSNLVLRAGIQVGVGEGRPDSKKSTGMGWGTFTIKDISGESTTKKDEKTIAMLNQAIGSTTIKEAITMSLREEIQ